MKQCNVVCIDGKCQVSIPIEMKTGCVVQWTADFYVIELILAMEGLGLKLIQAAQSLDNPEVSSLGGRVVKRLCISPVLSWHMASLGISWEHLLCQWQTTRTGCA